jgi:hypothetical protein
VDELLDAMEEGLSLLGIQLGGLVAKEAVDVGIAAVREAAAGGG